MPRPERRRTLGGRRQSLARVLLIEDDRVLRGVLRDLLEYVGFLVSTAGTELESRRLVAAQTFDVIVTDLFVPSTEDALTRVRTLRRTAGHTPVIVMTGT